VNRRSSAAVAAVTLVALISLTALSSCATFNRNDVAAQVGDRTLSAKAVAQLAAPAATPTGDQLREELTKWIRVTVLETSTGTAAPTTTPTAAELDARLSQALLTIAGDKAKTAYEAGVNGSPFLCLAAIVVATIDDANSALAAVNSGTSFADAVQQFSTDAASRDAGGVVKDQSGNECLDPAAFGIPALTTALQGATVGQPLAADLGDFAAVLMLRPFEDLLPASQASIASATVSQDQLDALVSAAKIYVDPRYGRWDPATGAVVILTS
jgi:hypothetical protein